MAAFALPLTTLMSINCPCLIFNKQQGWNDTWSVVSAKANTATENERRISAWKSILNAKSASNAIRLKVLYHGCDLCFCRTNLCISEHSLFIDSPVVIVNLRISFLKFSRKVFYSNIKMPCEMITLQLGQCGNQSK